MKIEELKKVDDMRFRIFSTELDMIKTMVKNHEIEERQKEAMRKTPQIILCKRKPWVFPQFQPLQDYLAMKALL